MKTESLKRVAYVSRACKPLDKKALEELMRHARKKNKALNVTGALIVQQPTIFLQVIEGPPESIDQLVEAIAADERHTDFEVIREESGVLSREFSQWMMGCRVLGSEMKTEFAELDNRIKEILSRAKATSGFARQLIRDFRTARDNHLEV